MSDWEKMVRAASLEAAAFRNSYLGTMTRTFNDYTVDRLLAIIDVERAEAERLRGMVDGLAARVAGQSELLSARAGRVGPANPDMGEL